MRHICGQDRATSFGGDGDAEGFDLDLGKWFGVYDGHGGQEAAEYVMSKLHTHSLVSRFSPRDCPLPRKAQRESFGVRTRGGSVRFLTEILDDFRQFVDEIWRF